MPWRRRCLLERGCILKCRRRGAPQAVAPVVRPGCGPRAYSRPLQEAQQTRLVLRSFLLFLDTLQSREYITPGFRRTTGVARLEVHILSDLARENVRHDHRSVCSGNVVTG